MKPRETSYAALAVLALAAALVVELDSDYPSSLVSRPPGWPSSAFRSVKHPHGKSYFEPQRQHHSYDTYALVSWRDGLVSDLEVHFDSSPANTPWRPALRADRCTAGPLAGRAPR